MTAQNPAAGKPVDPASLVNVPRLVTAYFASNRIRPIRPSASPSEPRAIAALAEELVQRKPYPGDDAGDLRSPPRNRADRSAVRRHRYRCARRTGAGERDGSVCRQRRRHHDRRVWRLHADARDLASILSYNKGRTSGLADGIVISPSHNPPEDGGYKYNPPHGGPADTDVTGKVEKAATPTWKPA